MCDYFSKKFLIFLTLAICFSQVVFADTVIEQTVSISARVTEDNGGGVVISMPTVVTFSGWAYPSSTVYILQDGVLVLTVTADESAYFSASIPDLETDTYTFSIYTEDSDNRKSSLFSFPILITSGTTVDISNIFLSPTINIDKTEVKKGNFLISGRYI